MAIIGHLNMREIDHSVDEPRELRLVAKSGSASIIGSIIDFLIMIALVEWAGCHPALATFIAAALGAIAIFFLNQRWVFQADLRKTLSQLVQFSSMAGITLLLNTGLMFLMVEALDMPYLISRAVISLVLFAGWSYPLSRFVIFRKKVIEPCDGE